MQLPLSLKDYVLSAVSATDYYRALFPAWSDVSRPNVACPFHDDKSPSLAVGLAGGGARCHAAGCGKRIGNIVHFESATRGGTDDEAASRIYSRHVRPVVRRDTLEQFQGALSSSAGVDLLRRLRVSHGLNVTDETSQLYGLGYDQRLGRLVIPVQNAYGLTVNLRFYKPRPRRQNEITIFNYIENKGEPNECRYGGNELFAWQVFRNFTDDYPVFIMASEKEQILSHIMGLQGVCSTAGEGSWLADWSQHFVGRKVGLLMDPDEGGAKATKRLIAELSPVCDVVRPITLPFPRGFRGPQDFDDWVLHCGGTAERLLALFDNPSSGSGETGKVGRTSTKPPLKRVLPASGAPATSTVGSVERIETSQPTGPQEPPSYSDGNGSQSLRLDEIRRTHEALNKTVLTQGLVAGIAQRSFSVPWRFKLIPRQGPPRWWTIPAGRELLAFINASDDKVKGLVYEMNGLNPRSSVQVQALEYHPITELELIPMADAAVEENSDVTYTVQRCFAVNLQLQANTAYDFRLIPTTMPQSQETVGLVVAANEINRQDDFILDAKAIERFSGFQPVETSQSGVWNRLVLLAREVAEHHSHIYERDDWHMVVLLTFFSPLQFTWPLDGRTQRGWMNTLAVGDTKTGKSDVTKIVVEKLAQAGGIVNSENCTFVGLVGGAIKGATGQFMLRWGRIPLGDRKLLVLEELSGLTIEQISNLSDVRSSGVARLDKGGLAGQTPARTRLLCLSNVRSKTKRLADFLSGVKAVQELVGHGEDISRFDLIITLTDREVSADVINRENTSRTTRPAWTVADFRSLCQWVWSLKVEDICISHTAARRCLELTLELGKDYHNGVPIFKASSDRHKIARIATAIACLQFSWRDGHVVVETSHMEAAARLLRTLYDKPSLGYKEFSQQMFERETLRDIEELYKIFSEVQPDAKIRGRSAEVLIHSAKFSRDELCATASLNITSADNLLGCMLRCRALRKGDVNLWEVTSAGKVWLESVVREGIIETSQRATTALKRGRIVTPSRSFSLSGLVAAFDNAKEEV